MAKYLGNGTIATAYGLLLIVLGKPYRTDEGKWVVPAMFLNGAQEGKDGIVETDDLETVSKEDVVEGRRLAETLGWKSGKSEQSEQQPRQQRSTTNDAPEDSGKDLVLQVGGHKITLYPRKSREDGEKAPVGIIIKRRGDSSASAAINMQFSLRLVESGNWKDVDTGVWYGEDTYVLEVAGDVAKK